METGNIVNIDYVELEAGAEKPGTKREAFVFEVGTGYNVYKIDDEVVGMKKGETKLITKIFPEDFETKALAGKTVMLRDHPQQHQGEEAPRDQRRARPGHQREVPDPRRPEGRHHEEAGGRGEAERPLPDGHAGPGLRRGDLEDPPARIDGGLPAGGHVAGIREPAPHRREEARRAAGAAGQVRGETAQGVDPRRGEAGAAAARGLRDRQEGRTSPSRTATSTRRSRRWRRSARSPPTELKESLAKNNLVDYMRSNLRMDKLYDFLLSKTTLRAGEKRKVLDILQGN